MTAGHRIVRVAACAGVALLSSTATAAVQQAALRSDAAPGAERTGRTLGFVLRTLYTPVPADPQACPVESRGSQDIFVDSLSPAEKARYGGPDHQRDLESFTWQRLGYKALRLPTAIHADDVTEEKLAELRGKLKLPPGKGALVSLGAAFMYDSCTNFEDFPQFDVGNQTYLGRISIGENLDGKIGKDNFVGPDGTKGIDNALLRATGCNRGVRDYGDPIRAEKSMFSQTAPTLIEVTGVDDLQNDPDVTVHVYAAAQSIEMGANGDALHWGSINVDANPRYAAQAKGRIVNGVIVTEPFAFRVRQKESVVEAYRAFVGSRFKIQLKPDGSISGELVGYQTVESLEDQYRHMVKAAADFSKTSCPAIISAIRRYADGFRDPKTKRFTAISVGYRLNGVPAFLIHPEQRIASADSVAPRSDR